MSLHLGACPPPPYQKAGYATVASFRSPEEWPNEDGRFRPPLATRNRRHWKWHIPNKRFTSYTYNKTSASRKLRVGANRASELGKFSHLYVPKLVFLSMFELVIEWRLCQQIIMTCLSVTLLHLQGRRSVFRMGGGGKSKNNLKNFVALCAQVHNKKNWNWKVVYCKVVF